MLCLNSPRSARLVTWLRRYDHLKISHFSNFRLKNMINQLFGIKEDEGGKLEA